MKPKYILIISFVILLLVVCYVCCNQNVIPHNPPRERFQILGAAADYQGQYTQCLNACGKEDPSSSFSSPNNLMCGVYCDYVISNMASAGIPPAMVPTSNYQGTCEEECEREGKKLGGMSHNSIRKCVSSCSSQKEVANWCAVMQCPYSLFPTDLCMNMCTSSKGANSNSNSWKWGRYG